MKPGKIFARVWFCATVCMLSCQTTVSTNTIDHHKAVQAITHTVKIIDSSQFQELKANYGLSGVYEHFTKYLGGLDDQYRYAAGVIKNDSTANLYKLECHNTARIVLIAEKDGQNQIFKTFKQLQTAFAPVDSPEEALSFVHLVHGAFPVHEYKGEFEEEVKHVEKIDAGYKVNLFHDPPCAHGIVFSTVYEIKENGEVNILSSTEVAGVN